MRQSRFLVCLLLLLLLRASRASSLALPCAQSAVTPVEDVACSRNESSAYVSTSTVVTFGSAEHASPRYSPGFLTTLFQSTFYQFHVCQNGWLYFLPIDEISMPAPNCSFSATGGDDALPRALDGQPTRAGVVVAPLRAEFSGGTVTYKTDSGKKRLSVTWTDMVLVAAPAQKASFQVEVRAAVSDDDEAYTELYFRYQQLPAVNDSYSRGVIGVSSLARNLSLVIDDGASGGAPQLSPPLVAGDALRVWNYSAWLYVTLPPSRAPSPAPSPPTPAPPLTTTPPAAVSESFVDQAAFYVLLAVLLGGPFLALIIGFAAYWYIRRRRERRKDERIERAAKQRATEREFGSSVEHAAARVKPAPLGERADSRRRAGGHHGGGGGGGGDAPLMARPGATEWDDNSSAGTVPSMGGRGTGRRSHGLGSASFDDDTFSQGRSPSAGRRPRGMDDDELSGPPSRRSTGRRGDFESFGNEPSRASGIYNNRDEFTGSPPLPLDVVGPDLPDDEFGGGWRTDQFDESRANRAQRGPPPLPSNW